MKKSILVFVLIFAVALFSASAQKTTLKKLGEKKSTEEVQKKVEPGKQSLNDLNKKTSEAKTQATKTEKKTTTKKSNGKLFTGYIVSLPGIMSGNYNLSKDQAIRLANAGVPLVLIDSKSKSGKVYFLVGQGGESLNKKLAKYAVYKKVAVSGKFVFVNRTRFIIVDFIESAE